MEKQTIPLQFGCTIHPAIQAFPGKIHPWLIFNPDFISALRNELIKSEKNHNIIYQIVA